MYMNLDILEINIDIFKQIHTDKYVYSSNIYR